MSHPSHFFCAETSRPFCRNIPHGPACNVDDATGVSSLLMCASGTDWVGFVLRFFCRCIFFLYIFFILHIHKYTHTASFILCWQGGDVRKQCQQPYSAAMLCYNLAENSLHTVNMSVCWLFFLWLSLPFLPHGCFHSFKAKPRNI